MTGSADTHLVLPQPGTTPPNASGITPVGLAGISSAQEAAAGLVKLSPSMNLSIPLLASKSSEPLHLTPFLTNSPFNTSPWMMVGMEGGFKLSPAMMADHQRTATYKHRSEHNKFQGSFSAALRDTSSTSSTTSADAEVPQLQLPRNVDGAGPASTERIVPVPPTRTRSGSKAKPESVTAARKSKKSSGTKPAAKTSGAGKSQSSSTSKKKKTSQPSAEEIRREKRREQNRINAAKCRQRKIDKVSTLQEQLDALRSENATLKIAYAEIERKLNASLSK